MKGTLPKGKGKTQRDVRKILVWKNESELKGRKTSRRSCACECHSVTEKRRFKIQIPDINEGMRLLVRMMNIRMGSI